MIGYSAGLPQGRIMDPVQLGSGAIPLRGEAPSEYQRTGTTVRVRGFERHPVVQACMRAIVDIAGSVPIQVYKKGAPDKDGREVINVLPSSHPAQLILDSPSSFLSSQRLRKLTFLHYLTYGNGLWFFERNSPTTVPVALRMIHPEDLTAIYVNDKGYPLWYMWRDNLGYMHTSPVTDIMHFRDLSGKGLVFGYPRAASALNDIIGDDEASQFVREVVTNSGAPNSYALVNEETTQEEAAIAEARLYEKVVARGNRGRFLFLGGVKDIKTTAFNLRDLEFPDLRRVNREDICAAFGVDPRMVGITSASRDAGLSGTQYTEARIRLIQQTVEPLMRDFESELNFWFAPEFGDVYCRFDPDSLQALVEDNDKTSTRVISEVGAGLRTLEEGREALDLPAEYNEEDTLALTSTIQIVPAVTALGGLLPGAVPGTTTPMAAVTSGAVDVSNDLLPDGMTVAVPDPTDGSTGGPAADDPDGANVSDTDPNDPSATATPSAPPPKKRSVVIAASPTSLVLTRAAVLAPVQRQLLWQQFDQRAVSDEAPYRRTALLQFAEERSNVGKVFARAGDDPAAARRTLAHQYKNGGEVQQRWATKFHPLIGETYAKGAEHIVSALKQSRLTRAGTPPKRKQQNAPSGADPFLFDFHLAAPDVQAVIQARAARLAEYVGETTGQLIDDAIAIGIRESMGMGEIADLVDRLAFGSSAAVRSERIARTETIGALNQGQYDTAGASGVIAGKEWLTQGDDRVRDSHTECEAQGMIGLDEDFDNGCAFPGDPDGDAGEVINCRCTLLYYDTLDAGQSSIEGVDGAEDANALEDDAYSGEDRSIVRRFNENHDEKGKFATADGGGSAVPGVKALMALRASGGIMDVQIVPLVSREQEKYLTEITKTAGGQSKYIDKIESAPIEMVPIGNIKTFQNVVYRAGIEAKLTALAAGDKLAPVKIVEYKGGMYLMDGNHTVAAHLLRGDTHVQARVLKLPTLKSKS